MNRDAYLSMQHQLSTLPTFVPMVKVSRITAKHTLGRLPIATLDTPESSCGMARRVGYTGRNASDLAIYRLKVKFDRQNAVMTLPLLFVVDDGKFIDYQEWQREHTIEM